MKEIIKQSKIRLEKEQQRIQLDIEEYLKNYDYKNPSKNIQIIDLKSSEDIKNVYSGAGFYIILTDKKFDKNLCTFETDNFKAIYRGHSYFVKDRLMSHLFNQKYQNTRTKYKPNYTVCLKIEDGVGGINIDQEPYLENSWRVIIHKMKDSTELIRRQAESAFDSIYEKPIKSREK